MKPKSYALGIIVVFFTVSSMILSQNTSSYQEDPDDFLHQLDIQYYANSPSEFFNETQNPRYPLVARLFGMIQYPNKVNPSIIIYDESLKIISSGSVDAANWNFTLHKTNSSLNLDIISSKYTDEKWYFETIPAIMEEGLYDLQMNCSEGSDYQTHAVKIAEEKTYPFSFVQVSDLHFPAYYQDFNTTDSNLAAFDEIKALNPDFVIVTGDLIQGPTLYFLNPITGKHMRGVIELRLALWALDTLDLPVYYVHGNHEFSQSTMIPDNLEDNWYNYLGPIRYQNFTFLDWTMVGFGSSFEGLNTEEIQKMQTILSEGSDGATALYYHYDFHSDATNFIRRYPIEVTLFGHKHSNELYLSNDVLYHQQNPLFYGGYSQFTITNSTSLTIHSNTYNFELVPYDPPVATTQPTTTTFTTTDTTTTTSYAFLFALFTVFTFVLVRKKKVKN